MQLRRTLEMMRLSFVLGPFILLVFHRATGAHGDIHSMLRQIDIKENDPDISEQEKKKLNEYRESLVKQEILRMLGLERPPNVSDVKNIPKEMLQSVLRQTTHDSGDAPEHEADADKQIVVIAQPDSAGLKSENEKGTKSNSMRFRTNVKLDSISSVTLVLRRNPQVVTDELLKKPRLLIAQIIVHPDRLSHLIGHPEVVETNGDWVKLDITSILKSKGNHTVLTNVSIEVLCEECGSVKGFRSSKRLRPFLLFTVKAITKTRERRSIEDTGPCSLIEYKVNFAKLGYDFVIYPKEISLNYCKGLCKSRDKMSLFFSRINFLNPDKTKLNDTCCVVSKMKSLSIFFLEGDVIKTSLLRNVKAMKCQCA
ncbi:growth/differentiation factor 8-like [Dendronephthya gigantea]|uniref:growth/differentiation factor 8-like n=1 Tax=Dendronephthya gigantea TaxID=151771 RepID=UPI00106DA0F0|nr:growth/differentiation factor 8-like [Dendronephthya gigantea]